MTVAHSIFPVTTKIGLSAKTPLFLRALNWLANCERRCRETVEMQSQSPERLNDTGIRLKI